MNNVGAFALQSQQTSDLIEQITKFKFHVLQCSVQRRVGAELRERKERYSTFGTVRNGHGDSVPTADTKRRKVELVVDELWHGGEVGCQG